MSMSEDSSESEETSDSVSVTPPPKPGKTPGSPGPRRWIAYFPQAISVVVSLLLSSFAAAEPRRRASTLHCWGSTLRGIRSCLYDALPGLEIRYPRESLRYKVVSAECVCVLHRTHIPESHTHTLVMGRTEDNVQLTGAGIGSV